MVCPNPDDSTIGLNTEGGFTISSVPSNPQRMESPSIPPILSPSTGHARSVEKIGFRKKIATESLTVKYVKLTYASENAMEPTTPRTKHNCHMGFGPKNGFLDRSGLLASVESTELITPISTQILHHGKSAWAEHCPETHVSNNPNTLLKLLYSEQGSWVLKPMAGSFGRGVQIIDAEQGPLLKKVLAQSPGSYFCLQRFLPEISTGEIRTLVVGGEIIGSYLRKPTNGLHANLAQMASTEKIQLEGPAAKLVARIQQDLVDKRIGFASIDTVGHWLMEVNIANPGGLGTLNRLYEHDFGPKVVRAVERFLN